MANLMANGWQPPWQPPWQTDGPSPSPSPREINPPHATHGSPPWAAAAVSKGKKQDIDPGDLTPAELGVAAAIAGDQDLAPIVARQNQLARDLCAAGPGLDVPAVVGDAARWLRANPARRKRNGAQFLLGWVRREQERRGGRGGKNIINVMCFYNSTQCN